MANIWSITNCFSSSSPFSITHRKRWKLRLFLRLVLYLKLFSFIKSHSVSNGPKWNSQLDTACINVLCYHGSCHEGKCHCDRGWQGSACHMCEGRTLLNSSSGQITDGKDNYSTDLQCTWLIDSGKPNATIWLKFTEFATECGWDHLYIFDGDSIYSPLIGAFSGVLVNDALSSHYEPPEILATSGMAYLYFYSDAAFNMSGFIIDYTTNSCPQNCSSHGLCIDGICTCSGGWTGPACDKLICPNDCSPNGRCDMEEKRCICEPGFIGADCSQSESMENWIAVNTIGKVKGRALHQSVVVNGSMWIIGGESFDKSAQDIEFFLRYDLKLKKWEPIFAEYLKARPESRSGHSLVVYNSFLYLFGGKLLKNGLIVNDLWRYNGQFWELVRNNESIYSRLSDYWPPLRTMGHTATVVNDKMIVIFGHSPIYGYLNTVQEYDFTSNSWTLVETSGAIVRGGFGHSSVYYPEKDLIYVYGGYHSSQTDSLLVDSLYSYSPSKRSWRLLSPSLSPRYLHSSVIISGMMFIFGGNGHNSTHDNAGNKCFSVQFLAYDIECDSWSTMNEPPIKNVGRYGHSAVVYNNEMYIFGGFNGLMLNSLLKFYPGDCIVSPSLVSSASSSSSPSSSSFKHLSSSTVSAKLGYRKNCFKSKLSSIMSFTKNTSFCETRQTNFSELCLRLTDCDSCLENTYGCVWCGDSCHYEKCRKSGSKGNVDPAKCDTIRRRDSECDKIDNCQYCHSKPHCKWQNSQPPKCIVNRDQTSVTKSPHFMNTNYITMAMSSGDNRMCDTPCYTRSSCFNCSHGSCMWCSSNHQCIDSNAYAAIYSLGQCMEWTIHPSKCSCSISQGSNKCIALNCTDIATCDACQKNPRCGWCDDGLGTGVGKCLEGSYSHPKIAKECPFGLWFFVSCPRCQCNGHSECTKDPKVCDLPCKHLTEGSNCQRCRAGHYGNPVNGGKCHVCKCKNHSSECNPDNGKCFCTTKGITGHNCEKCDEAGHYHGDPAKPGGSCFYNLSVDFQYTFNMSKPDDKYFSRINFMNAPSKPDVDVDFTITCSGKALVNISIGSPVENKSLQSLLDCGSFKLRFSHEDNSFGSDNTTFFVNVYDFKTPFVLQISFSQHRTLDLLQFFVTFSTCFLTLLIIAAILWKIKQRYDIYRRRQQAFLELEHMASRPFASIFVELRNDQDVTKSRYDTGDGNFSIVRRRDPTPIAVEPCATGKAAVLSLILRLPSGGQRTVPPGQTGLAIGSALVTLGTMDQKNLKATEASVKTSTNKGSNSSTGV